MPINIGPANPQAMIAGRVGMPPRIPGPPGVPGMRAGGVPKARIGGIKMGMNRPRIAKPRIAMPKVKSRMKY